MSIIDLSRQKGDTIVEVMLVLAVLGLAISISYATANTSLLQAREAQENAAASAILQSQVERLAALNSTVDPVLGTNIFQQTSPFCIDDSNHIIIDAASSFCRFNNTYYNITISYCRTNPGAADCTGHTTDDTFILRALWENVQGKGNDQVSTTYRLHP